MFPHRISNIAPVEPETYSLGEKHDASSAGFALALVFLSHTKLEQRIYAAMLATQAAGEIAFTARSLISLMGIRSLTTLRRGLEGLIVKLSIERAPHQNGNGKREQRNAYRVYSPDEILSRRKEMSTASLGTYGTGIASRLSSHSFERAIARMADNPMLSRREAQVALSCVEGLTNA